MRIEISAGYKRAGNWYRVAGLLLIMVAITSSLIVESHANSIEESTMSLAQLSNVKSESLHSNARGPTQKALFAAG